MKTYLINKADVSPEKFTPVMNYGISRPLSYSKTEQDRKVNRMVYVHLRNVP